MKNWVRNVGAALLLVTLLTSSVSGNKNSSFVAKADEYQEMETEKNDIEAKLDQIDMDKQEIESMLDESDLKLYSASVRMNEIQSDIERAQEKLARRESFISYLERKIDLQRKDMKQRIQYMYENSAELNKGNFLLFFTRPLMFLNGRDYIDSLMKYDRNELALYEQNYKSLEEEKRALEEENAQLQKDEEEIAACRQDILDEISSRKDKLENIEKKRAKTEKKLEKVIAKMLEYEEKQKEEAANQPVVPSTYNGGGGLSLEEKYAKQAEREGTSGLPVYPKEGEEDLLAAIIYCESGSEAYECQLAVGSVVLNRVTSTWFPNTITEVIYAPRQFSPVASGRLALALSNNLATESCRKAAHQVLNDGVTGNWLYFRLNDGSRQGLVIGVTVFY